ALRQVSRGVEGGRAGKEVRIARSEQKHLLAAHAPAEAIDTVAVEPKPGKRTRHDTRHSREIGDLARITPGVALEHAPLPFRVHDRERSERREVSPERAVRSRGRLAAVRREDQRQPWV